jgi:hypothetical protein
MDIKAIEDAIIAKLQTDITGVQIEGFPENLTNYQFIHPVAAILVQYRGADFERSKTLSEIHQVARLEFACVLISRGLRTHAGAYAYLDQIRASLTGYQINGLSKMQPVSEKFIDEQTGVWFYETVFTMNGRNEE